MYLYIYISALGAVGQYHSPSIVVGIHACLLSSSLFMPSLSVGWVSLMLASSRVRIAASFAPMFQPRQVIRLWMMAMKYGWTTPVVLHSMYWVLALTRGALPNLVASCVPAGFPHVFDDFWYFWMWGDVLKVCVPAVFGEGLSNAVSFAPVPWVKSTTKYHQF